MIDIAVVDSLYRLLLYAALALLAILLQNSLFLYKRKVSDPISLMLLAAVIMSVFEIIWEYSDGNRKTHFFGYLGACGYVVAFIAFGAAFNYFFMDRFGMIPKKKIIRALINYLPVTVIFLVCLSTPWTSLMVYVDEEGVIQEGVLFSTLYYGILLIYLFNSLVPAVSHLVSKKKRNTVTGKISGTLLIFCVMAPVFYLFEMFIIGDRESDYLGLSTVIAIALVYLVSNVNTHLLMESQAKFEAVEADLRIAAKIQSDALPPIAPEFADHLDLSLRASINTAREVGGDFYDYFPIGDRKLCFLIADVSGKGTPAALFMMTTKTVIKDYALTCGSTSEIFTEVNRRLCENNEAGMFATAWIGILDTATMTLQYTNAGHNYPMFLRKGEKCTVLKKVHGLMLAAMEDTEYRQTELQLEKGDRILLYTDGVTEAHNTAKELYGMERLTEMMEKTVSENGEQVIKDIVEDVNRFAGEEPQFDDITMMIFSVKE